MKRTAIMLLGSIFFSGCTGTILSDDMENKLLVSYGNGAISSMVDKVEPLTEHYRVDIADKYGYISETYNIGFYENTKEYIKSCPVDLKASDIENRASIFESFAGKRDYYIINREKADKFTKCIIEVFSKKELSDDDLGYFLNDKRILDNKSDPLLKSEIWKANQDNKITYGEIIKIYSVLDKVSAKKNQEQRRARLQELSGNSIS